MDIYAEITNRMIRKMEQGLYYSQINTVLHQNH